MYKYTRTHTHTHIYMYIHTHTYIRTHMCCRRGMSFRFSKYAKIIHINIHAKMYPTYLWINIYPYTRIFCVLNIFAFPPSTAQQGYHAPLFFNFWFALFMSGVFVYLHDLFAFQVLRHDRASEYDLQLCPSRHFHDANLVLAALLHRRRCRILLSADMGWLRLVDSSKL